MTTYPNLNNEPELLKIKTQADEIKNLKKQTEKHDHENIIKSLKIDNEYCKKKYKNLNKKKVLLIITEILIGSGSAISTSTMSLINTSIGIVLTSSTALLTSLAILITNEYNSKLKLRYTKLRDWINFITILYEKTLNQSMIDKKIDEKEAVELKKIYNHYVDKRKEIMDSTKFKVEDIFGDVISKDSISLEQITKLNNFFSKNNVNININIKFIFFKKEKIKKTLNRVLLPNIQIFNN